MPGPGQQGGRPVSMDDKCCVIVRDETGQRVLFGPKMLSRDLCIADLQASMVASQVIQERDHVRFVHRRQTLERYEKLGVYELAIPGTQESLHGQVDLIASVVNSKGCSSPSCAEGVLPRCPICGRWRMQYWEDIARSPEVKAVLEQPVCAMPTASGPSMLSIRHGGDDSAAHGQGQVNGMNGSMSSSQQQMTKPASSGGSGRSRLRNAPLDRSVWSNQQAQQQAQQQQQQQQQYIASHAANSDAVAHAAVMAGAAVVAGGQAVMLPIGNGQSMQGGPVQG
eukprot:TRINITY_DN4737_c0_g1_i1.p1 TRINITY_DN4737_c0_g1~~TRINITY_DN4737_c0_g1_i1.p1  ORF type:complete len:281 (-),score=59.87 TRINITY_DN4737_c0_g1_i1:172-1014(-)